MNEEQGLAKKPSRIKAAAKFFFDPPTWLGIASLTEGGEWIGMVCRRIFRIRSSKLKETFEEAMVRMGTSEEDLLKQEKAFFRNSFIFLGLAILALFYFIFLLRQHSVLVSL